MLKELTLKGCIEFAITTEEWGVEIYKKLAEKFSQDPEIAKIFSRLSDDEMVHKQQFSELLAEASTGDANDYSPEKTDYLKAMSFSMFFSPYQGPFKDMNAIKDRDDALQKALDKSIFLNKIDVLCPGFPVTSKFIQPNMPFPMSGEVPAISNVK